MDVHRKKNFNIPVFLHHIKTPKRVKTIPLLCERKIPPLRKRKMSLHVYFYVSILLLYRLLQQIGICRMTSMKLRHCRIVWGSLLNTYPQSFVVHFHEAIGGTVHVLMLERVE